VTVLWLEASAARLIRTTATGRRLRETGGPLFGYVGDNRDVVVSEAYGPGPAAHHERLRLIPDHAETQRLIEEIHDRSEGRLSYLGDWHTHPGGSASPSGTDLKSLRDLAADAGMDLGEPVIVIVATTVLTRRPRVRAVRAFHWNPAGGRAELLLINHLA
jgi:integrative and conjugative element protein (TIGR02256 family)